jgi:hypothetical protein
MRVQRQRGWPFRPINGAYTLVLSRYLFQSLVFKVRFDFALDLRHAKYGDDQASIRIDNGEVLLSVS